MRNGTELLNHLNLRALGEAAGVAIESIKINAVTTEWRDGRPLVVKQRRAVSEPVAAVANVFFHLARGPISVCVTPGDWQRWETGSFLLLNGDRFRAFADGERKVCADRVPGENLRSLLSQGALTGHILDVAARELRGPWSHGDLQMSNIIYDKATDSARLVDFEIMHDPSLPVAVRHADDLLVFLQDMMWRVSAKQWVPYAEAFVHAYGRAEVTAELEKMLVVPHGVAGLWWKIRTNHFNRAELVMRVEALRRALDSGRQEMTGQKRINARTEQQVGAPASLPL